MPPLPFQFASRAGPGCSLKSKGGLLVGALRVSGPLERLAAVQCARRVYGPLPGGTCVQEALPARCCATPAEGPQRHPPCPSTWTSASRPNPPSWLQARPLAVRLQGKAEGVRAASSSGCHPCNALWQPPSCAASSSRVSCFLSAAARSQAFFCSPGLIGAPAAGILLTPSGGLSGRRIPCCSPPYAVCEKRAFGGRAGGLKRRKRRRDPGVLQQSGRGRRLEFFWPRGQRLLRIPLQQNSRPSLIYDLRFRRFLCRWTSNGQHVFRPFNCRSRPSGRDGGRGVGVAGAAFGHVRDGGFEGARAKALVLLRQLQRQGKLDASLESTQRTKPEINRSGVRGVYFEPEERLWVAVWKEAGLRRFRAFSAVDMGFQAAYQAAVAVRRQQLAANYEFCMQRHRRSLPSPGSGPRAPQPPQKEAPEPGRQQAGEEGSQQESSKRPPLLLVRGPPSAAALLSRPETARGCEHRPHGGVTSGRGSVGRPAYQELFSPPFSRRLAYAKEKRLCHLKDRLLPAAL
ncbi:hypothetical protein Efla_004959 [Eimeria flavescens]